MENMNFSNEHLFTHKVNVDLNPFGSAVMNEVDVHQNKEKQGSNTVGF